MIKITHKDLKEIDKFTKYGDVYRKVFADDEKHIYVFKREREGKFEKTFSYEVIKGVKYTNPDGTIVYIYPSINAFGLYGYYIFGADEQYCKERIEYRIKQFRGDN